LRCDYSTPKASSPRNTGSIDRGINTLDQLLTIKPSDNEGHAYEKRLTLESPYKAFPTHCCLTLSIIAFTILGRNDDPQCVGVDDLPIETDFTTG
jgi:hypothetical protein